MPFAFESVRPPASMWKAAEAPESPEVQRAADGGFRKGSRETRGG